MAYATPSDPLLLFAFYSGLTVFMLTIALLATIAVLRYSISRREHRERALSLRWQPVFFHAVEGIPLTTPRIYGRDRETILLVWIHFTESIRGEARQRLRQLALDLKLDRTARKLLERRNIRPRLIGVVALGRMHSRSAWEALMRLVADPIPMLSLLAARSLLQIDAAAAVPILLAELERREDWPLVKVAAMLREVPPAILAEPLKIALSNLTSQNAPRLLSLMDIAPQGDTWPVLAPLLEMTGSTEVIAAALKACNDPRALEAARLLTTHAQWIVRAQAATVLGRMGTGEDRLRLQALLGDPEWWVRYRAAQAMLKLPSVSREKLQDLCAQLNDRYAVDILTQALAETAREGAT